MYEYIGTLGRAVERMDSRSYMNSIRRVAEPGGNEPHTKFNNAKRINCGVVNALREFGAGFLTKYADRKCILCSGILQYYKLMNEPPGPAAAAAIFE